MTDELTIDDLPEKIQSLIVDLSVNAKKSTGALVKELNEILKYKSNIKEISNETIRYNSAFSVLKIKYTNTEVKTEKTEIKETDKEIKTQIKELKDKNLISNIIDEVHKEGTVGEEDTIIILTIKIATRYLDGVHPPSQNIIMSSRPGFGKDETVNKTLSILMYKTNVVHKTNLSDKAMLYRSREYPNENWDEMVLYLEDPPKETITTSSFRTLATGKTSSGTVIDKAYVDLEINGKPVLIVTSYQESLDFEGERRWGMKHTDETDILTQRCNENYSTFVTGRNEFPEPIKNINLRKGLQTKLKRQKVIIPFFDKVKNINAFRNRYGIKNLADYISASAVLHQYQRNKDGKGNLIATYFDWDIGLFVYNQLHNRIEGSLNTKELELFFYLAENPGPRVYSEIEEYTNLNAKWLYDNVGKLKERGIIKTATVERFCGSAPKLVKALYLENAGEYIDLPFSYDFNRFSDDFNAILRNTYMIDFNDFNLFKDLSKNINNHRTDIGLKKINLHAQNRVKSVESVESIKKGNSESPENRQKKALFDEFRLSEGGN